MSSHNPKAQAAWDNLIAAIVRVTEAEGDMAKIAQLSMTREQADILYPLTMMIGTVAGEVRVIREQQSSKSKLNKAQGLRRVR